jgi:hypothetical protein
MPGRETWRTSHRECWTTLRYIPVCHVRCIGCLEGPLTTRRARRLSKTSRAQKPAEHAYLCECRTTDDRALISASNRGNAGRHSQWGCHARLLYRSATRVALGHSLVRAICSR